MLLDIVLLVAGLVLIVSGAEFLVDGSTSVARRYGMSEFIIGLTIVGMGTSMPEMVVSLIGAVQGNSDVAVGNIMGSNIFNVLLILGLTAIIRPMPLSENTRRLDMPVILGITILFLAIGLSSRLFGMGEDRVSRLGAAVLLVIFIIYMVVSFLKGRESNRTENDVKAGHEVLSGAGSVEVAPTEKVFNPLISVLLILGGLAALVGGGRLFVNSATSIASALGVSDKFIAITILAGGTSLPELATCVVAAIKNQGQLALGNVIGSNIFNILLIGGLAGIVSPLSFSGITNIDAIVLLLSSIVPISGIFIAKRNVLDRIDGSIMLAVYICYMFLLFGTL